MRSNQLRGKKMLNFNLFDHAVQLICDKEFFSRSYFSEADSQNYKTHIVKKIVIEVVDSKTRIGDTMQLSINLYINGGERST